MQSFETMHSLRIVHSWSIITEPKESHRDRGSTSISQQQTCNKRVLRKKSVLYFVKQLNNILIAKETAMNVKLTETVWWVLLTLQLIIPDRIYRQRPDFRANSLKTVYRQIYTCSLWSIFNAFNFIYFTPHKTLKLANIFRSIQCHCTEQLYWSESNFTQLAQSSYEPTKRCSHDVYADITFVFDKNWLMNSQFSFICIIDTSIIA